MTKILDGTNVIVTGAGQGVGRGVALAMAPEGARVAVVGLTLSKCEGVAAEIAERGGTAIAVGCDVTSRTDIDACVAEVRDKLGPVQVLVNCAQSMSYGSVRRITEEDLDAVWRSGFVGTLNFMQACFEDLRATRGSVINFGSGSGLAGFPAIGAYASVKEAVRTLSRVTAVEWGKYGVRVNVVCPLAESPGYDAWSAALPGAGGQIQEQIPLQRLGDPETDIGRVCVFLAGPDSGYITGTTLMADGGLQYLR